MFKILKSNLLKEECRLGGGGGRGSLFRWVGGMGESRRQQSSVFRSLLGQAQSHPGQAPALYAVSLPAPAQDPLEHRSLNMCLSLLLTALQAQASPHSVPITPIPTHASGTLLWSLLPKVPTLASVPSYQSGAHAEEAAGTSWGKGAAYPGRKSREHSSHDHPIVPGL